MSRIAILGFGVEGKSSYKYLKELNPKYEIDIFDEKDIENDVVKITTVKSFLNIDFSPYGVIVRSPSIPPNPIKQKIITDKNGSHDFNLTSATQIFFDKCPAKIIGVTGTKGKGTTASFITSILRTAGKTVHLVGNIGEPAPDDLSNIKKDDIVVYELSSFQLWDLNKSPYIAVLTMIGPDHLDVHANFDEYVTAKENIVKSQTVGDVVVYNQDDPIIANIAMKSKGRKIAYPNKLVPNIADWVKVPGQHNINDAMAAVTAVWGLVDGNLDVIKKSLENFVGLPHHIELVREISDVKYYDDSFSSNPSATKVAIESFNTPIVLILGGFDKKLDFMPLADIINSTANIKKVLLIGQTKEKLAQLLNEGLYEVMDTTNFEAIIKRAKDISEPNDIVLLSPGAASFDMFRDFYDRGEKFKEIVNKL
jgi:UDP-N-acetylmuramoylalanine--D-glutamate ligase